MNALRNHLILNDSLQMGMPEKVCEVCREPIKEGEPWFRVRQEYAHLLCAEKYLRRVSERRKQANTAPPEHVPGTGG